MTHGSGPGAHFNAAVSRRWIVVLTIGVVVLTSLRFWALHSRGIAVLNVVKPALAIAQPIVLWAVCAAFARDWRGILQWRGHFWLSVALLIGFAAANGVLHPHFDRSELRALGLDSDIDDEFIVSAGNALHLRSRYAEPLYTGNPISEGPAWVILNAIFGSKARFFLLAPAYAAMLAFVVWRTTREAGAATLALLVSLASTGLWESSFGGDLAAAGFAMAAATLLCLLAPERTAVVAAGAMLIGAVATVRLPFAVFPLLAALVLYRTRARKAAAIVLICGTAVAVGSHAIFWAAHPGDYPPLHLTGQSAGSVGRIGLAAAAMLAAAVAGLLSRSRLADGADVLVWQGLGLFVPFAVVAWQSIMTVGLTGEDWTRYVAPAIPSFAAAVAIATYRRSRAR